MWQFVIRWHRRVGIVTSLFVVLLVITGLMLNHTEILHLDSRHVQNELLLDTYDIGPVDDPIGFQAGEHWISQVGERIYLGDVHIAGNVNRLVGAVLHKQDIVVAFDGQLIILDESGEQVERLTGAQGVPAGMQMIGISPDGQIVIRGSHGDYLVDLDTLDWHEEDELEASWSRQDEIPAELYDRMLAAYRGMGLPYERVILDLHSGRFLGDFGIYIIDLAALLFLFLAVTGIWMWFKRV